MATDEISAVKNRIERKQLIRRIAVVAGVVGVLVITFFGTEFLQFDWDKFGTVDEWVAWLRGLIVVHALISPFHVHVHVVWSPLPGQFNQLAEFVGTFLTPNFEDLTNYTAENEITGWDALIATLLNPGTLINTLGNAEPKGATILTSSAVVTVAIGFVGTVIGFPLAFLFGVLGTERVTPFPFNFVFRGVMSTIRSIPALVWILIYVPLVGIGPMGAVLAIGTDTIGNLGRLFTDELEEINDGPIEAIESTGANQPQTVVFGMLSQVSNSFIAWTLYILEINVRIAISLGVVGAGGLGRYISQKIGLFQYSEAAAGIVMVIFIVLSVELTSTRIRAYLRPGEGNDRSLREAVEDLFDGDKWIGRAVEFPGGGVKKGPERDDDETN